jgi:hypothetical protein
MHQWPAKSRGPAFVPVLSTAMVLKRTRQYKACKKQVAMIA